MRCFLLDIWLMNNTSSLIFISNIQIRTKIIWITVRIGHSSTTTLPTRFKVPPTLMAFKQLPSRAVNVGKIDNVDRYRSVNRYCLIVVTQDQRPSLWLWTAVTFVYTFPWVVVIVWIGFRFQFKFKVKLDRLQLLSTSTKWTVFMCIYAVLIVPWIGTAT